MDACIYNEIPISTIERNTSEHVWLDQEFETGTPASLVRCSASELSRSINIHGPSRANYHIPPLTKGPLRMPFKKLTTNTCSSCQDFIDLTI